ncbi:GNAT family N-acetyltransferase [Tenacibaculum sp. TC6]|uniref:GNAT family N-acetyltransferase n=1 Tax=Tenacibaculum sp. TC6 TaxID=3423223 RepID=UPI003D365DAD
MVLIIRKAQINDTDSIQKLSNQLGYPSEYSDIQQRLRLILEKTDHRIFVAETNHIVIGWIHCFYAVRIESEPFIEIGGLIVDVNYRKQGVGKQLIQHIKPWGLENNCSKIRVRSNTTRENAHLFYQILGFSIRKEQKVFEKQLN